MKINSICLSFVIFMFVFGWFVFPQRVLADKYCGSGYTCNTGSSGYLVWGCTAYKDTGICHETGPTAGNGTCLAWGSGPSGHCGYSAPPSGCESGDNGTKGGSDGCQMSTDWRPVGCCQGCTHSSWGECSVTCGGGIRVDNCGTEEKCNEQSCCTETNPAAPSAVSPLTINEYTEKTGTVTLTWTAVSSWGEECSGSLARGYQVCFGPNSSDPCTGGQSVFVSGENTTSYNASGMTSAINYWSVKARNKANMFSTASSPNSFCFYGSDSVNPYSTGAWSSCDDGTHLRSRTCVPGCDCDGVVLEEVCQGRIRGTIFDASDIGSCPGPDASGYISSLPSEALVAGQPFNIVDQVAGSAPNFGTWTSDTFPVTTSSLGNYQTTVYAPATYTYDFEPLSTVYDITAGPRLSCTSETAYVPGNLSTCLTQPCSLVTNMSFGLWRIFGGWWQVKGGNVYGANGIQSTIPPMMTANPQQLILPNSGRYGVLSYGLANEDMLGSNPNAEVSDNHWEVLSKYKGLRYDYTFYKTRMDVFASTTWGADSMGSLETTGYKIFKNTGDLSLDNAINLTGGRRMILLVDGSVSVNQNIMVDDNSYLAIIANGNITFAPSVTDAQGWFVGENINVPCKDTEAPLDECDEDDVQFRGEGSFVGWTNINLTRDQGLPNNQNPAELFTYRPDMFINSPEPVKVYTRKFIPFVP